LNLSEFSLLRFDLTAKGGELVRQFALSTLQKRVESFVWLINVQS
jgi:hypothetical protein